MLADEESVQAGGAQVRKVLVSAETGLADRDTMIGNLLDELEGSFRANGEGFQVAIIYAEDAGAGGEGAIEFGGGVNFDQRLHAEFAAEGDEIAKKVVGK